jgi:uncharacterized protein (DUF2141 family)
MSNALALAAITAVLKELLEGALPEASDVGGAVEVTARAPDLIQAEGNDQRQLNLFLYQVTPNPGWANVGLPARDGRGERTANPPLALDLHYLLTAYASANFQAEIILGYAMQCLHQWSVLPRKKLGEMQSKWKTDGDALRRALGTSDLANQVEQIKICPERIGVEGLSNLWTAFQTNYRPTAAYLVSVALIESALPARSALPVLRRGPEDRGAVVPPDLTPPFPTLVAVMPPNQQPSVRLGETLTLSGFHLLGEPGDHIEVMAKHPRLSAAADLELQGGPTATEIRARLPDDPHHLPAGTYALTVGYKKNGQIYRTTNQLPFSLAPTLTLQKGAKRVKGKVRLEVKCTPQVWQGQRASLLLNDREVIAARFKEEKADTLTFTFEEIPAGDYWLRLRVDGVESLLVNRAVTPPEFDVTQKVTIP